MRETIKEKAPKHIFSIPQLDFSTDIFQDGLNETWFRLGAWTEKEIINDLRVEDVVSRQSLLITQGSFSSEYENLSAIGNDLGELGKPQSIINIDDGKKTHKYLPFYEHEFHLCNTLVAEPLVFVNFNSQGSSLFINPDLYLFLELEERNRGNGIWWDPRRGVDVITYRKESDNVLVVDIKTTYLLKYLMHRQRSLLVAHYRHLHDYNPTTEKVKAFITGDVILGSVDVGFKALLQNWGLREDLSHPFLQRRLHLWIEILPPEFDYDHPWEDKPKFDIHAFTLPTKRGVVAPARFRHISSLNEGIFEGTICDFMDRVYFHQEVLQKYEGANGFLVEDDGSVSCSGFWGLTRSTFRLGNELISTAIGDFAEGVPFDEWPHWKQYSVDPPSDTTLIGLGKEVSISSQVSNLVNQLLTLNDTFNILMESAGNRDDVSVWSGSMESLACKQLKWFYPSNANEDEFLKRATLMSTLIIDGFETSSIRKLIRSFGEELHLSFDDQSKPLGSRVLLQRLSLISGIISQLSPRKGAMSKLVQIAEKHISYDEDSDLQMELISLNDTIRDELAPLAHIYDFRLYAGIAHTQKKEKAASTAVKLGFSERNWQRSDYINLIILATKSVEKTSQRFYLAAEHLTSIK